MSEAAKVLMERANIVRDRAEKDYEHGMARLNKDKKESLDVYRVLTSAAKEVCDHYETVVSTSTRVESGTHGRCLEDIEITNCAICGKHIKTVEV